MSEHECSVLHCERPARMTLEIAEGEGAEWFCAEHYDKYMKLLAKMREEENE